MTIFDGWQYLMDVTDGGGLMFGMLVSQLACHMFDSRVKATGFSYVTLKAKAPFRGSRCIDK